MMPEERESGVPCPFCGGKSKCTDSRPCDKGTRRRRKCVKCEARFTTYEFASDKEIDTAIKTGMPGVRLALSMAENALSEARKLVDAISTPRGRVE